MDLAESPADTIAPPAQAGGHLKALGYLGLEVSDLAAWEKFAQDVLGLQAAPGPTPDTRLLKMDDRPWRFILVQGPADDIAFAGWEVGDDAALDAYARHLADMGVAATWAGATDLALRGVSRLLQFSDPNGVIHEVSVEKARGEPFTPRVAKGAFVTGEGGLGHIVFGSQDYAASVAFAQKVLGVGLSDTIEQVFTETMTVHVTFMHINERHHSIAFANRAGDKALHHFMIEVERVDDVGRARDRHLKADLGIAQDIGQHPNDQMISYYGVTPSGFLVEYGWGGVKVDVGAWTPGSYSQMSEWGHRPLGNTAPTPAAPSPSTIKETAVSATGDWTLSITTPMGQQKAQLTVADDLSGEITSMGEPVDIYDGAFEGEVLSFKANVSKPFPMTLAFSLKLTAAAAAGEVKAGMLGVSPVTGERA